MCEQEAACQLTEDNILGHDSYTGSAFACQAQCMTVEGCYWFTHFGTECYMLAQCGQQENCEGCTSGPTSPDLSSCPWPPGPTTSPTPTPSTTTRHPTTPGPSGCENFQVRDLSQPLTAALV